MATKRKRESDDLKISEIQSTATDVNVHGIITQLSPVKVSKKNEKVRYFDGKLTDGKKSLRIVSFEPILRPEMDKARINKTPITIMNCQVKEKTEFTHGNDTTYEILASTRSKVHASPHKIDLPDNFVTSDQPSQITLSEIEDLTCGQQVSIRAKVVHLDTSMPIQSRNGKLLHKQESIIADETGQIRLVLWEENIDKLVIEKSYKLDNLTIRMYNDIKYLSMSSSSIVESIQDIGSVASPSADDDVIPDNGNRILDGSIIVILSTETYPSCIRCQGKITCTSEFGKIGQCQRCHCKLKVSSCVDTNIMHILFQPTLEPQSKPLELKIFSAQIDSLTASIVADNVEDKVLSLDKVRLCINNKNIVYSASTC